MKQKNNPVSTRIVVSECLGLLLCNKHAISTKALIRSAVEICEANHCKLKFEKIKNVFLKLVPV